MSEFRSNMMHSSVLPMDQKDERIGMLKIVISCQMGS